MRSRHFNQAAAIRAFLVASGMYLSLTPAMAADPMPTGNTAFDQLDVNHDGYIDAKEATAMPELAAVMKTADKNKDGKLSEAEFYAVVKTN